MWFITISHQIETVSVLCIPKNIRCLCATGSTWSGTMPAELPEAPGGWRNSSWSFVVIMSLAVGNFLSPFKIGSFSQYGNCGISALFLISWDPAEWLYWETNSSISVCVFCYNNIKIQNTFSVNKMRKRTTKIVNVYRIIVQIIIIS